MFSETLVSSYQNTLHHILQSDSSLRTAESPLDYIFGSVDVVTSSVRLQATGIFPRRPDRVPFLWSTAADA